MISRCTFLLSALLALLFAAAPAGAVISEPDCIVYGTPSVFGEPPPAGAVIDIRHVGESRPLAVFIVGSRSDLGRFFELRVPVDSTGAPEPGRAREGAEAGLYIGNELAGSMPICGRGTAVRLDIDPENVAGEPEISIDDVVVVEGDAGTVEAVFTISLSHGFSETVDVDWATTDGSAQAPADYQSGGGTVSFVPASLTTTVSVTVVGETDEEPVETFSVELSNPVNGTLLDPTGVGTIGADDAPFVLQISNVEVLEGDGPVEDAVFEVTVKIQGAPDASIIEVDFETADGTAVQDEDYLAGAGRLTIDTGIDCPGLDLPCAEVRVSVLTGVKREPDEVFFVRLSNPSGAVIGDGEATGTILNDENFLVFVQRKIDGEPDIDGPVDGLFGAAALVVSPDGAHVYASGRFDQALGVFAREPNAGELTFVESHRDGQAGVDGLGGVEGLAISPDGAHLYAAGYVDDALAVLSRDTAPGPDFGKLTFIEATGGASLDGPLSVAVSPDGRHVYAAAFSGDAVAVLERGADPLSPGFGRLTFAGAAVNGKGGVSGLRGATAVTVHCSEPDCTGGGHVYAVAAVDSTLTVFARDAGTGLLTPLETHVDGLAGVEGLGGAAAVLVSQDGAQVYAAGQSDNAVAVFSRAATGKLTFVESQHNQVAGVFGLEGISGLAIDVDGSCLYASSQADSAVTVFGRNPSSGALTFIETRRDGEPDPNGIDDGAGSRRLDGLAGGAAVAAGPAVGANSVYVVGTGDNGLAVFVKDVSAPPEPLGLSSPSHVAGAWSNDPTVDVVWSASDNPGGAGVSGYASLFDTAPTTDPGFVLDRPADPQSATSASLPDGIPHYFHLRSCDRAGNCSEPAHLGPFWIDTARPGAPTNVVGSNQTNTRSTDPSAILMRWESARDGASGLGGYAYAFDMNPTWACTETKNLRAKAVGVVSPEVPVLTDGMWYFHVCAVDLAGNWSVAVDAGEFLVGVVASAGAEATIDFGDSVVLGEDPTAVGGTPPYTYVWTVDPLMDGRLDSTSSANPTFTGERVDDYVVQVVATDSLGRSSAPSEVEIRVVCPMEQDLDLYNVVSTFGLTEETSRDRIVAEMYRVTSDSEVVFRAGETIVLGEGFVVEFDGVFTAMTGTSPCGMDREAEDQDSEKKGLAIQGPELASDGDSRE